MNRASLKIRLDWSELDAFGHINNVAYFKYFQAARIQFTEIIGLDALYKKEKIGFVVAETHCKFLIPMNFPDEIEVLTSVEKTRNSSIILLHKIMSKGKIAANGRDVLVVYDYQKHLKCAIPDTILIAMKEYIMQ